MCDTSKVDGSQECPACGCVKVDEEVDGRAIQLATTYNYFLERTANEDTALALIELWLAEEA